MKVEVITPEKVLYSAEAVSVVLPAWDGEMEVLATRTFIAGAAVALAYVGTEPPA